MMNLDNFIYDFNIVTTQTVNDIHESCFVINNGRKKEINYSNCVSLYDVVKMFNSSYLKYLEDKDELKRVIEKLGEDVSYISHIVSNDFVSLCLDVSKPRSDVFEEKYAVVYFFNNNGNYFASINNGINRFDEGYKSRSVSVPEDDFSKSLDIVKKNGLFFDAYKDLRNKFIFGNGTTVIFSKVDGELFDELETFTLTFGNAYMNRSDFIEVKFKLGNNFEILYDESKLKIDDEEVTDSDMKRKVINELLSSLYVKSDKLCELYQSEDLKKVYVKGE